MANQGKVLRFGKVAIFAQWIHAITFFLLGITGLLTYTNLFDVLLPLFGGNQGARLVHRTAAVAFMVVPVLGVLLNPKGFVDWMKCVFSWNKNDSGFFSAFIKELFGGHPDVPPQGKFNAGEKVNSLLQVGGCTFLAMSGLVLWFQQHFPKRMVLISYPIMILRPF